MPRKHEPGNSGNSEPDTCETTSAGGAEFTPFDPRSVEIRQGACLPHWSQKGATYSVTFRLVDSLPQTVLGQWLQERSEIVRRAEAVGRTLSEREQERLDELHSERAEKYLDAGHGACHLKDPRIAALVRDAVLHFDGQRYDVVAWCVMPNHVHVVVRPREGSTLTKILHSWKSFTSTKANGILGRRGPFWQPESFDHLLRDARDFERSVEYVLRNPQSAGLQGWHWVGRGTGFRLMDGNE